VRAFGPSRAHSWLLVCFAVIASATSAGHSTSVSIVVVGDRVTMTLVLPPTERISLEKTCARQSRRYSVDLYVAARAWLDRRVASSVLREIADCDATGRYIVTRTIDGRIIERSYANRAAPGELLTPIVVPVFEDRRLKSGTRYLLRVRRKPRATPRNREDAAELTRTTFVFEG
jgi:hypothetical protein